MSTQQYWGENKRRGSRKGSSKAERLRKKAREKRKENQIREEIDGDKRKIKQACYLEFHFFLFLSCN